MSRRLTLPLFAFVVVLALLTAARPALADPLTPDLVSDYALFSGSEVAQSLPPTATACDDLVAAGRSLSAEIPDLAAPGPRGNPRLCLLHYDAEDVYAAVILRYDSAAQFRIAKADAAQRLLDQGFDLCGIGRWAGYGRTDPTDRLQPDDVLDLPVICPPRVVALDGGTGAQTPVIQDALDRIVALTADQMGWQPNRPLTVLAVTDADTAAAVAQRYVRGLPADELARRARDGRSVTMEGTVYGTAIELNLVTVADSARRSGRPYADEVGRMTTTFLAHEYTHFAQNGIGGSGTFFPKWFLEGQADYQQERNGGVAFRDRDAAVQAQIDGSAPHLADLSRDEDWFAHEAQDGSLTVYSRGYAAVAYLADRYGFDATVRLLRDNHDGSIEHFNALLTALTGLNLAGLDDAVGAYLLSSGGRAPAAAATIAPPNARFVGADDQGYVHIDFTISADGSRAQGQLTVARDIPCSGTQAVTAGVTLTFALTVQPDGTFSGATTDGTATITLDGRFFTPDEVGGAMRYDDAVAAGCDTGPVVFIAHPVLT